MENCKVKIHLENAPSCCKFRLRAVWRQDPSTIWKKEWKKQKLRQQQRNGNQGIDWQREWLSGAKINGGEKIQHTLKKTAPSLSTSLALCPGLTTCQSVSIAAFLAQSAVQNLEKTFHKNCPLPRPSQLRGNTWRIEWGGCIIWTKGSDITNDLEIVSQRISSLLLGLPRRAAPLDYVRSYIFSKFYHYRQFRLISALVSCFHIISLFSIVIVVIRVCENLCRSRNPFFPWGSGEGELEGGDVAIDNFTFLIFIIITVIYWWVNNRLICKFVKNDAQTKEKMFATMFLH